MFFIKNVCSNFSPSFTSPKSKIGELIVSCGTFMFLDKPSTVSGFSIKFELIFLSLTHELKKPKK